MKKFVSKRVYISAAAREKLSELYGSDKNIGKKINELIEEQVKVIRRDISLNRRHTLLPESRDRLTENGYRRMIILDEETDKLFSEYYGNQKEVGNAIEVTHKT